ncbi:hypothetical protein EAF04_008914 [Stromatinia cepivora]|nr:hypothetical protein EAF04_008914 [Stromatinia cepivora]
MTANKESEKLNKLLGHTIVHVKVGDDLKDFGIHKDLICHYSPYFKAAFNSGLEESITGIMKLPETKPEVFELFYHWLYNQDLEIPPWEPTMLRAEAKCKKTKCCHCNPGKTDDDSDDIDNDCAAIAFYKGQIKTLVMLHVFADMARTPILQNNCMKKFYETTERAGHVPTEQLAYIWKHTHKTSLLQKTMIDMLTWELDAKRFLSERDTIPNVVKDEVLVAMSLVGERKCRFISPLKDLTNYYVKVKNEST